MTDSPPAAERRGRALMGVVAASALVYPLLVCAVQLVLAQLLFADAAAVLLWLALAVACSVAVVAAVRWGASRPVLSRWLLVGLVPPAVLELWLLWPQLAP
jgi:positive regulator of sigma E activity